MDPFDHANTLNDDRMDDKKWVEENSVDVLMIVVGELRKLFEVVPEMAERTDQSLEQLQNMIRSNKSLIDEQNDKINQLMGAIGILNGRIVKIQKELREDFASVNKDLDGIDKDLARTSSQNNMSR